MPKKFLHVPRIFRNFSIKRIKLIKTLHILIKIKFARPNLINNCKCYIKKSDIFKHDDGGILYETGKFEIHDKIIVCYNCFKIFNYDSFNWKCLLCKEYYNNKKSNIVPNYYSFEKNESISNDKSKILMILIKMIKTKGVNKYIEIKTQNLNLN